MILRLKFYFKQKTLFFWTIFSKKAVFLMEREKVNVTIEFGMFELVYYPGQNKIFGTKYRNEVKLDKARKIWYLLFLYILLFWLQLPKCDFWKIDWALGYVSSQNWDFPNISAALPKILSLDPLGNLRGNSYSKFAILDMTFCFTCG